MRDNTVFVDLAEYIMFNGYQNTAGVIAKMEKLGLEYRKNKDFPDIIAALRKAKTRKYGFCKTEIEIRAFAMFLEQDIVKKKRKRKADVV